jgi:hypothetical protein
MYNMQLQLKHLELGCSVNIAQQHTSGLFRLHVAQAHARTRSNPQALCLANAEDQTGIIRTSVF